MSSFITYTLYEILVGWWDQAGWHGLGT